MKNPNSPNSLKNTAPKGFSLIEVMFAMIFLTIIVFGVIKLQTSNLMMSDSQNNQVKAHFIASQGLAIVEGVWSNQCSDDLCNCALSGYTLNCSAIAENLTSDILPDATRVIKLEKLDENGAYMATAIVKWSDSTSAGLKDEGDILTNKHEVKAKRIIY